MADIYTSTGILGTTILAEEIDRNIMDNLQQMGVIAPLVKNYDLRNVKTNSFSVPIYPTVSLSTIGETADLTSSAFTPTEASITPGEKGWMTVLTYSAAATTTTPNIIEDISRTAEMGIARAWDVSLGALFGNMNGGATVGAGNGATALTTTHFLKAIMQLEINNVTGPIAFIGDPRQVHSLRLSLNSSSGSVYSRMDPMGKAGANGLVATNIYGVNVYQTNSLATTGGATSTTRIGAMLAVSDQQSPLAIGYWRPSLTEVDKDISRRGFEIVTTTRYGVVEIRDLGGISVRTR